jgi:hypothetical protein
MLSKEWKWIALTLLAISLTACSHKKNQGADGSPYEGIWVNQETLSLYREYRRQQPNAICAEVRANPALFGVQNGQSDFGNMALLISGSGNVYNYDWSAFSSGQRSYRDAFLFGRVDSAGRLNRSERRYAQAYDFAPQYAGAYGEGEIFTRVGNLLTRQGLGGGSRSVYLRSNGDECREFQAAIDHCLHMWGGGSRWRAGVPPMGPNVPPMGNPNLPPPAMQMGPPPQQQPQGPSGAYQFGPPQGADGQQPGQGGPQTPPSWEK